MTPKPHPQPEEDAGREFVLLPRVAYDHEADTLSDLHEAKRQVVRLTKELAALRQPPQPTGSTLSHGSEIESEFYHLKAHEWAVEPREAERLVNLALIQFGHGRARAHPTANEGEREKLADDDASWKDASSSAFEVYERRLKQGRTDTPEARAKVIDEALQHAIGILSLRGDFSRSTVQETAARKLTQQLRERATSYRKSGPSAGHTALLLDQSADMLDYFLRAPATSAPANRKDGGSDTRMSTGETNKDNAGSNNDSPRSVTGGGALSAPAGDVGELVERANTIAYQLRGRAIGMASPSLARDETYAAAQTLDELAHHLRSMNSRLAEMTRERDDYRQSAQVEAGLRREFLVRAEKAERERDAALSLADQRKNKKETVATARNRALDGMEHFKARAAAAEQALRESIEELRDLHAATAQELDRHRADNPNDERGIAVISSRRRGIGQSIEVVERHSGGRTALTGAGEK